MFLVVYTSAHLIGAVSKPLTERQCARARDFWVAQRVEETAQRPDDPQYTFACEQQRAVPD